MRVSKEIDKDDQKRAILHQGIAHCMKRDINESVIPGLLTRESENQLEWYMKQFNNLLRKINNGEEY